MINIDDDDNNYSWLRTKSKINTAKLWDILGRPLTKEKKYVDSPADAPKGANVQQGKRGGYFYETTGKGKTPDDTKILDNLEKLTRPPIPKKPLPGMVGTSKYTQGVFFEKDIPVNNLISIENGLRKVFNSYGVGVVQLSTTTFYEGADSVYMTDKSGDDLLSDYIGIDTNLAKNPKKTIEHDRKLVQKNKQKRIKTIEDKIKIISEDLKNTTSPSTIKELKYMLKENETDLEGLNSIVRWTTTQDAKDPLENVMIHEAYHAVFAHKKLYETWNDNIKNIGKNERFKVSEYAASDNEELFAETGAAIESGLIIPESIKRAFEETLRGV